jgi:hypothetical protein
MGKLLAALAVFGTTAAPALAQATPQPAPAQKAETVTKVVCERVRFEESTGSRLGPAPKKCTKPVRPRPLIKPESCSFDLCPLKKGRGKPPRPFD